MSKHWIRVLSTQCPCVGHKIRKAITGLDSLCRHDAHGALGSVTVKRMP